MNVMLPPTAVLPAVAVVVGKDLAPGAQKVLHLPTFVSFAVALFGG